MRWGPLKRLRRRFIDTCSQLLTKPLGNYVQRVPNDLQQLRRTLRKGDVLLVEGDQRVSQVIRYLTQSSWSHSSMYIGDELLRGSPERAQQIRAEYGEDACHLLVEAVEGEGVRAIPISKYERYNIRICRPRLRREDVQPVLAYVISHLGDRYDTRHILDLALYFFPVSIVPRRWRRAALHLGSGADNKVICSTMIARAFARVGYPIAPQEVTVENNGFAPSWWRRVISRNGHQRIARFRRQDPKMITPRDFDLSPYFEVVKFNHLSDARFDYRSIIWETEEQPLAVVSEPEKSEALAS